jgi:dTDP-4-amino-4,6-dideoxygalactose transaminase
MWPPLPVDVYVRRPLENLPFPLEDARCRMFSRARHGLWQAVQAGGLREGDQVLVPAYHHGSEVEALSRAGLLCTFYEGDEELRPDGRELERLLTPRTRALHLIHYLGFPQDSAKWRRWCDEHELLLIEDAAQAWLASHGGTPTGSHGDISIFCLYKTIGVPDGAAVVAAELPEPSEHALRAAMLARRHAAFLTARSSFLTAAAERLSNDDGEYSSEEDFALGSPSSAASSLSDFLVRRLADPAIAAHRRANYEFLLERLSQHVLPGFDRVPEGASPFAFPIVTDDKERLVAEAARQRVLAVDFWSVPHPSLPVDDFPGAQSLRSRVLALPVHQELRTRDLERVAAAVAGAPRRRTRELRLEPFELDASTRSEWNTLAAAADNVFATWEWNSIWWRHFGRHRRLLVRACRSNDGSLVAVLPAYASRERPLRIVRLLGHREGDNLAPISAPGDRPAAARAFRRLLREVGADVFVGEHMPGQQGWAGRLDGTVISRTGSPVLNVNGATWDDLLAARSANFREQVRRRERKLRREHDVEFRFVDDPSRLPDALETLFSLHRARWRGEGAWRTEAPKAFHREFAAAALGQGWLRLWLLDVDGKTVAAWYGLRFEDTESYYQSGRDPEWDPYAVGFVLLAHTVREALSDGVREYRFLEGGESYKYRFANEDRGLDTIGVGLTRQGSSAVKLALAARRSHLTAAARAVAG